MNTEHGQATVDPEGDTCTKAVADLPFMVAVRVTVALAETVPAVVVKVPVDAPDETVTLAGTGRAVLLLDDRLTTNPLPVAALVSVTVQEVVCPDDTLDGEHPT
ncbi:MAG TPA: hypothetical protein VED59_09305, partial [Acidimicrobiales bacterium]|nr:hypothetical protein [Acidimicrobiales bacterium]